VAELVLGTAGGAEFGPFGAVAGAMIGRHIDKHWLYSDKLPRAPAIEDVEIQRSEEGVAIPFLFGTMRMAPNGIWIGEVYNEGYWDDPGEPDQDMPHLRATFAVALCKGEIDHVGRMWTEDPENGTVLQFEDFETADPASFHEAYWRVYKGGEDHPIDPTMESFEGEGNVPTYKGLAFILFKDYPLYVHGNQFPTFLFEVTKNATTEAQWQAIETEVGGGPGPPGIVRGFIGFEIEDLGECHSVYDYAPGTVECSSAQAHSGSYSAKITGPHDSAGANIYVQPPGQLTGAYDHSGETECLYSDLGTSFWVYVDTLPTTGEFDLLAYLISSPFNYEVRVRCDSDGILSVENGGDDIMATGTHALNVGAWNLIQFRHRTATSQATLYVNGDLDVSCTVTLTSGEGIIAAHIGYIDEDGRHSHTGTIVLYIDDVVFTEGEVIRPLEIAVRVAGSNGAHTDFNNDYQAVDELPQDGIGTTVNATGSDKQESFVPATLAANGTITAVATRHVIVRASLSSTSMRIFATSNGVTRETGSTSPYNYQSDDVEDWDKFIQVFPNDFGRGNIPWTAENVSALDFGIDLISTSTTLHCTSSVVMILYATGGGGGSYESTDHLAVHRNYPYVTILTDNLWQRYNKDAANPEGSRPGLVDLVVDHSTNLIPHGTGDFDADEQNTVYTSKTTLSTLASIVALSGDDYSVQRQTSLTFTNPLIVRVSQNGEYPVLAFIAEGGAHLYLIHRDTMEWTDTQNYKSIAPPSGTVFTDVFVAEGALIWALAVGGGSEYLVQIKPDYPSFGDVTQLSRSISVGSAERVTYDTTFGYVLVAGRSSDKIVVYSYESSPPPFGTFALVGTYTGDVLPVNTKAAWQRGPVNGALYYALGTDEIARFDLASLTQDETWTIDSPHPGPWENGNLYVDGSVITGSVDDDYNYVRVWLLTATSPTTLAQTVTSICAEVGIEAADIDVSDLTGTELWGYEVPDRMAASSALQTLMDVFGFDRVESDGKIKWPMRGRSVTVAIPRDDLGAYAEGNAPVQRLQITRDRAIELPHVVELRFRNYDAEQTDTSYPYMDAVARFTRAFGESDEKLSVGGALAMTQEEADYAAERIAVLAWVGRTRYKFSLLREYAYLDAADVVTVVDGDGETHRVRIDQLMNEGGVLRIEGSREEAGMYDPPEGDE